MEYINNATLIYRYDYNKELAVFRVLPDEPHPEFVPGQYAELAIIRPETAKLERRSYSIASVPGESYLEFYIVLVKDGQITPQLWELKEGDRLWCGPKIKGKFTLEDVPKNKDLIMVATGTGLAPFMSMLRQEDQRYTDQNSGERPWDRVLLIHGARLSRDLGYLAELQELQARTAWFSYLPTLTRESASHWSGATGRVQGLFENHSNLINQKLSAPISVEKTHVLICGNPQMIEDLEKILNLQGLFLHKKKTPGNIHVERYW